MLSLTKWKLLDLDAWSELGSFLETSRSLPSLHFLSFRLFRNPSRVSFATATAREQGIRERFPCYAARGILDVHTVEP
jgi:hypothetical protein